MLLAKNFLRKFAEQQNRNVSAFSKDASAAIRASSWPGNIRELENKIKRAVVMCDKPVIDIHDLQLADSDGRFEPELLRDVRSRAESQAIINTLAHFGTVSEAAKHLGVTRPTLYSLVNRYELESYLSGNQEKSP